MVGPISRCYQWYSSQAAFYKATLHTGINSFWPVHTSKNIELDLLVALSPSTVVLRYIQQFSFDHHHLAYAYTIERLQFWLGSPWYFLTIFVYIKSQPRICAKKGRNLGHVAKQKLMNTVAVTFCIPDYLKLEQPMLHISHTEHKGALESNGYTSSALSLLQKPSLWITHSTIIKAKRIPLIQAFVITNGVSAKND